MKTCDLDILFNILKLWYYWVGRQVTCDVIGCEGGAFQTLFSSLYRKPTKRVVKLINFNHGHPNTQ